MTDEEIEKIRQQGFMLKKVYPHFDWSWIGSLIFEVTHTKVDLKSAKESNDWWEEHYERLRQKMLNIEEALRLSRQENAELRARVKELEVFVKWISRPPDDPDSIAYCQSLISAQVKSAKELLYPKESE